MEPTPEQQERLDSLAEEIDKVQREWIEAGLPPLKNFHTPQFDPFYHACSMIVVNRIFTELLGVTQADMDIMLREVILKELKDWKGNIQSAKEAHELEQLRSEITRGIHFKPPVDI